MEGRLDYSLSLKIGTIFIIFSASFLSFIVPTVLKKYEFIENIRTSSLFLILKGFASGIILGVALMHLLWEGVNRLKIHFKYPLGLALFAAGILLTLGLDQATMYVIQSISSTTSQKANSCITDTSEISNEEFPKPETTTATTTATVTVITPTRELTIHNNTNTIDLHVSRNHPHSHASLFVQDINRHRALIKLFVLEFSIAIHSVILGYSFGALHNVSMGTMQVMMSAAIFHQFFEGIGLGATAVECHLSIHMMSLFALFFALSWATGGVTGILHTPENSESLVQGCINSLVAGLLVYSALVEMIAEDFSSADLTDKPALKSLMYTSLGAGLLAMAILAIYC